MKIDSVIWRPGCRTLSIEAEQAFKALEEVRKKNNGDLTDDAIVKAAKAKNHQLHPWFTWDDSAAAIEHRRTQARELIRSVRVIYKEAPESVVRAYEVHRKTARGNEERTAYRTTSDVLQDPESRDQLIAAAIRMAMEFRRRFRGIHELEKVIEAIDRTLVDIGEGR